MTRRAKDGLATLVAIAAIASLEALALLKGVDGTLFVPAIVAIAALGGAKIRDWMQK